MKYFYLLFIAGSIIGCSNPKFKVGDCISVGDNPDNIVFKIENISNGYYIYRFCKIETLGPSFNCDKFTIREKINTIDKEFRMSLVCF